MSDFNVTREAKKLKLFLREWANLPDAPLFLARIDHPDAGDRIEQVLARCRDAAVRETEEADIKAVCGMCNKGWPLEPYQEASVSGIPARYHKNPNPMMPGAKTPIWCNASAIHERRRREEGT